MADSMFCCETCGSRDQVEAGGPNDDQLLCRRHREESRTVDLQAFVNSLSQSDVAKLYGLLYDRRRAEAMTAAQPLDELEQDEVRVGNRAFAIMSYKQRLNTGLFEAKVAIDKFAATL